MYDPSVSVLGRKCCFFILKSGKGEMDRKLSRSRVAGLLWVGVQQLLYQVFPEGRSFCGSVLRKGGESWLTELCWVLKKTGESSSLCSSVFWGSRPQAVSCIFLRSPISFYSLPWLPFLAWWRRASACLGLDSELRGWVYKWLSNASQKYWPVHVCVEACGRQRCSLVQSHRTSHNLASFWLLIARIWK